jgi:tetratricopeptide (TPR) repeat protein
VPEDNEKGESLEVVKTGARALARRGSALVRRGLDDLSKRHSESQTADLWFEKGVEFWDNKQHAEAISCFEKAIDVYPSCVDAWLYKAASLKSLGRLTDAIESLNRCLEIAPSSLEALRQKGFALADRRRFEDAVDCFDLLNQIEPENVHGWLPKAAYLCELRRYDEALRCCEKSLANDPENDRVTTFLILQQKGAALAGLERFEEAVSSYDSANQVLPDNTLGWLGKGSALHKLRRFDDALSCYDKFLEVEHPEDETAEELTDHRCEAWHRKGVVFGDMGRYSDTRKPPSVLKSQGN